MRTGSLDRAGDSGAAGTGGTGSGSASSASSAASATSSPSSSTSTGWGASGGAGFGSFAAWWVRTADSYVLVFLRVFGLETHELSLRFLQRGGVAARFGGAHLVLQEAHVDALAAVAPDGRD